MRGLFALVIFVLCSPLWAADIAVEHDGGWTAVAYSTTSEEDSAAIYYRDLYDDNLCLSVGLLKGCSPTAYVTAGGTESFYGRNGLGAKQFFMDQIIKKALENFVTKYNNDLSQRARLIWQNELSVSQKEATCTSWGKNDDCTEP
jgi:hypothetical protein